MVQASEKYIFIVGCPRSGTTLLQQILNAHSEIAIAPETHFVRRFWLRRHEYGELEMDSNYRRIVDDVCAMPEFAEMEIDPGEFQELAWKAERTYPALFARLLEQFAQRWGAVHVGEKTPNHLLYLDTLRDFFPSARFVHIVRDPRAVVNSWRTVPWSTGTLMGDAAVWRRYSDAAHRDAHALYSMRYESLVSDPATSIKQLCEFLDVRFDEQMLSFYKGDQHFVNPEREPWKVNATGRLHSDPVSRWRSELTRSMIAQVEAVTWRQMRRSGYGVESPPWHLAYWRAVRATKRVVRAAGSRISRRVRW